MADSKITALTAITTVNPATYPLVIVDTSDTSMAITGTTKKVTTNQLLGSGGTATLASATITGALTAAGNSVIGTGSDQNAAAGRGNLTIGGTSSAILNLSINSADTGYVIHDGTNISLVNRIAAGSLNFYTNSSTRYQIASDGVATWSNVGGVAGTAMTLNSTGLNIANGNVILGTSGKGIDFSATASGSGTMTSELLSDYEEGTFTAGIAFGNASVGVTYSERTAKYTKIGRQVTVCCYLSLTNKGSSTGGATITGLPFTIASDNSNYCAASLWLNAVTFADFPQAYGSINSTQIVLSECTNAGVRTTLTDADFANNSEIIFTLTYNV